MESSNGFRAYITHEGRQEACMKGRKLKEAVLYKQNSRDCSGIDGYRHWEQVLKTLLAPCVEELRKKDSNIVVT